MSISIILSMISGLAMFLYGMQTMGKGLEKAAGEKMSMIIDKVTGNIFKALLIGTAVTAVIQSSNATTVMVVGFINAGMMTLSQAFGVMLGADIGTTITSVLVSLEDLNSNALWILGCFKPSFLAPIAVGAGVIILFFIKKNKFKPIGEILAGFGILFIGMGIMSDTMAFLQNEPWFEALITTLSNPLLGVLFGFLLTVVIESSSASVGILQAASATGLISFSTAAAIVLGENLGACITALLSSVGTKPEARRAAVMNMYIKLFGAVIFVAALYLFRVGTLLPVWNNPATKTNIALFHIMYNVINACLMIPLSRFLVWLCNKTVPDKLSGQTQDKPAPAASLDVRLINTPSFAIAQTQKEIVNMMTMATESVMSVFEVFKGRKEITKEEFHAVENEIDIYESKITQYLIRLTDVSLTNTESTTISTMFHIITDIERIGDHAFEMANSVLKLKTSKKLSDEAEQELTNMFKAVMRLLDLTVQAYEIQDISLASAIHPLEDVVDYLEESLKSAHMDRLARKVCNYDTGIVFLDLVNSLERISDHCSNIALAVEQVRGESSLSFDPHTHLRHLHENRTSEYVKVYEKYLAKYTR